RRVIRKCWGRDCEGRASAPLASFYNTPSARFRRLINCSNAARGRTRLGSSAWMALALAWRPKCAVFVGKHADLPVGLILHFVRVRQAADCPLIAGADHSATQQPICFVQERNQACAKRTLLRGAAELANQVERL